jgi:glycosyl transferase family 1/SEC-C motif-containing protein
MSVVPVPVSRLSPCPCGSGRRYKDCHGALAPTAAAHSRRSSYRPSGPEWDLVSEADRDRLGVLMEAALVHQREGRVSEAARQYRDVLAIAPQTHDALHMLGMARWSDGDYVEAQRLIEEALKLRPEYPAIRQNLSLVLSAQRAREKTAQEALCEKALPVLFDLLRSPEARTAPAVSAFAAEAGDVSVHLIGVDDGSDGDDAWMLRRLAALLAPVRVWSPREPEVATSRDEDAFPTGGVQLWVGVDTESATRLGEANPRRTLVFAQSAAPSRWLDGFRAIAGDGARPLELVVDSTAKAARFGSGHHVLPVPLDFEEFTGARRSEGTGRPDPFVVGNVVQDGRVIAHARAGSLQEKVATAGFRLSLYDPGRARHALGAMRHVKCVSRHTMTLAQFLEPLSCYLYCCDTWWKEGLGRELFGAMALGIPVLCPRTSIHAEHVRDGVDGILYDDDAGTLAALAALRDDPARRSALGAAAAASARAMFDPDALALAYRRLVAGA